MQAMVSRDVRSSEPEDILMDYLVSRGVKNRCRGIWWPPGNFLDGF